MPRKPRGESSTQVSEPLRMPKLPAGETPPAVEEDAVTERTISDIEDILLEIGGGAIVRIRRINEATGNASYVGQMKADEFSLDALADAYGGGAYYLTVHNGRDQIGARIRQEIDMAIPPKNPRAPRVAPGTPSGAPMDTMMALMAAGATQQQQMMGAMGTMMQGFATAMAAMMQNRPPEQNPMELLRTAAEVLRPSRDRTPISELKELMELGELVGMKRDSSGGDDTLALVGKGIEAVKEIAKAGQAAAVRRVPAGNPPVATVVPPAPTALPVEPTGAVDIRPWYQSVQPRLALLKSFIGNLEPATVADIIEQSLDEVGWSDLVLDIAQDMKPGDAITVEACVPFAERTCSAFKIPPQHTQWMATLAKEVLEIANDTEGEEENDNNVAPPVTS